MNVKANLLAILLGLYSTGYGQSVVDVERLADAIYKAEGGAKTAYPYGIRSINTNGDKDYARKICINSIKNAEERWIQAGKPEDFIVYMGRRYSPPNKNPNWVKLVKFFLTNNK